MAIRPGRLPFLQGDLSSERMPHAIGISDCDCFPSSNRGSAREARRSLQCSDRFGYLRLTRSSSSRMGASSSAIPRRLSPGCALARRSRCGSQARPVQTLRFIAFYSLRIVILWIELKRIAHHFVPVLRLEPGILVDEAEVVEGALKGTVLRLWLGRRARSPRG